MHPPDYSRLGRLLSLFRLWWMGLVLWLLSRSGAYECELLYGAGIMVGSAWTSFNENRKWIDDIREWWIERLDVRSEQVVPRPPQSLIIKHSGGRKTFTRKKYHRRRRSRRMDFLSCSWCHCLYTVDCLPASSLIQSAFYPMRPQRTWMSWKMLFLLLWPVWKLLLLVFFSYARSRAS